MKRGIEANNYIPYIGAKKKNRCHFFAHPTHFFEEMSWLEKVPVLGLPPRRKNPNPPCWPII